MTTFKVEIDVDLVEPISDDEFGDAVDSLWDVLGCNAVFASDHPGHVRAVLLVDGVDEPDAFLVGLEQFTAADLVAGLPLVRFKGLVLNAPARQRSRVCRTCTCGHAN